VLEHVGSVENQARFTAALCRVASRVFVSVPNRYFPIEHHIGLPIAHYQDNLFRAGCRLFGKSERARKEHLILMTRRRLLQLAAPIKGKNALVGYTGLPLGPLSSDLFLALA
jgi:hypothetical protein